MKRRGKRHIPVEAAVARAFRRAFDEHHPMWNLVGSGKSGGAGPGSSDKLRYLAEEAGGREIFGLSR